MFFETALASPPEIRPLQIFYGIIGFANAVAVARNLEKLETFVPAHGLSDISALNAQVEELSLRFGKKGAFQRFNDSIAPLGRICYFDSSMPTWIPKPFDDSGVLIGTEVSLKDILSRVPSLEVLYEKTFAEKSNNLSLNIQKSLSDKNHIDLRIDDPLLFSSKEELVETVGRLRSEYSFLENWCLSRADIGWGNSMFVFENIDKSQIDEFSADFFSDRAGRFSFDLRNRAEKSFRERRIDFVDILPPIAGGLTKTMSYVVKPMNGAYLSEFSLQYLGCFLLSTLVRYKPQIWQRALMPSVFGTDTIDDKSLALIEKFLDLVVIDFPKMVVCSIDCNINPADMVIED